MAYFKESHSFERRAHGEAAEKNIDPSSALEFTVEVPAQSQSGNEVQEGAVQSGRTAARPAGCPAARSGHSPRGAPGCGSPSPMSVPASPRRGKERGREKRVGQSRWQGPQEHPWASVGVGCVSGEWGMVLQPGKGLSDTLTGRTKSTRSEESS